MHTGNARKPKREKPVVSKATVEPAATLHDDGKFLRILTELPGIAEERIRIDIENHSTSVTIIAADTGVNYKKVIIVPYQVRFTKKRFSDGVLELVLEKTDPASSG